MMCISIQQVQRSPYPTSTSRTKVMGSFKSTQPQYGLDTEYPIILWTFSGIFFTSSIGFAKN